MQLNYFEINKVLLSFRQTVYFISVYMTYFITLLFFVLLLIFVANCIKISGINGLTFNFFTRLTLTLTLLISLFSISVTQGKTVFLIPLLICIGLIYRKKIEFIKPSFKQILSDLKYLIWLIPIYLVQLYLYFNFSSNSPFIPSDDIFYYAGLSEQIIRYSQENRFAFLSEYFPNEFYGISPYHYFELWMNGLLSFFGKLSNAYCLVFVTYPILIWLFLIGILSLMENFSIALTKRNFYLPFLLLFFGPVYISFYETIFNDGNFFASTVFTIPGFVKQTLSFSYYGQKHLVINILSVLLVLFIFQKNTIARIVASFGMVSASFGLFPGIIGGNGLLTLVISKFNKVKKIALILVLSVVFFGIISLNKIPISNEISQKTFYFSQFLSDLNIKGEVLRIFNKLLSPLVWFSILYLPFIILFLIHLKSLKALNVFKEILYFIIFSYFSGAAFTVILDGINTDQFITNLLPVYNVICISLFLYIVSITNLKKNSIYFLLIVSTNVVFAFQFNQDFRRNFSKSYSPKTMKRINKLIDPNETISYLLSDDVLKEYDLIHRYNCYPAKYLMASNHFKYFDLNYPYIQYEKNSSTTAFSPANHLRFFMKEKINNDEKFELLQVKFLKRYRIKWLICDKNTQLPKAIIPLIRELIEDPISGERIYRLR